MHKVDCEKIFWKELDGDTVVLNSETGEYFTLNKVGALVWNLIIEESPEEEIIAKILSRFEVDTETAKKDYEELIQSLVAAKILAV